MGEVSLVKSDSFQSYEVSIKVSFRQGEPLQRLSSMRQSGGEKSLVAILYILALQETSVSPIKLIDEINQGMDEKNERLTHNLLVETSLKLKRTQYFLITPKLLTDLEYSPDIDVFCIYSNN